jgi:hypothetical protein
MAYFATIMLKYSENDIKSRIYIGIEMFWQVGTSAYWHSGTSAHPHSSLNLIDSNILFNLEAFACIQMLVKLLFIRFRANLAELWWLKCHRS